MSLTNLMVDYRKPTNVTTLVILQHVFLFVYCLFVFYCVPQIVAGA